KAEEGDAVAVGEVVCLIDTDAKKPEGGGDDKEVETYKNPGDEGSNDEDDASKRLDRESKNAEKTGQKAAPEKRNDSYAAGTPAPAAKEILEAKGIAANSVFGSGRGGRITKDDAVQAKPAMGTPGTGKRSEQRKKLSMLRRKVAERLV